MNLFGSANKFFTMAEARCWSKSPISTEGFSMMMADRAFWALLAGGTSRHRKNTPNPGKRHRTKGLGGDGQKAHSRQWVM